MDEKELRRLLNEVKAGHLPRRSFLETMLALGLTPPMVSQMFTSVGIAHAQPRPRHCGGCLRGVRCVCH